MLSGGTKVFPEKNFCYRVGQKKCTKKGACTFMCKDPCTGEFHYFNGIEWKEDIPSFNLVYIKLNLWHDNCSFQVHLLKNCLK